ncbi:Hypothetical protein NGAL_HAMBI2605_48940 [Neorhizobium galegae bv. orientalis]|nr:Hypothetical protein NGAL_HAMBI2605_48940 [Neorhizobium galegae bv. orientalis]
MRQFNNIRHAHRPGWVIPVIVAVVVILYWVVSAAKPPSLQEAVLNGLDILSSYNQDADVADIASESSKILSPTPIGPIDERSRLTSNSILDVTQKYLQNRIYIYIKTYLFAIFTVIAILFLSFKARALLRSRYELQRGSLPKEATLELDQPANSSYREMLNRQRYFEGTISGLNEIGMGVVKFYDGEQARVAVFAPDVTWKVAGAKWLRVGQPVKGLFFKTDTGYRISKIEQGGAA